MKKLIIGCDHGGFELKPRLAAAARLLGWEITDIGCMSAEIVRYPYYAAHVAKAVAAGTADRGLLICSTGIGMSVMANKYRGIRAALCTSDHMARMTREHNDSNVLCLGGKITQPEEAEKMLRTWLTTAYIGGRHEISLGLIREAESQMLNADYWSRDEALARGRAETEPTLTL
jgi:ribose 5-phosphate isomerase B